MPVSRVSHNILTGIKWGLAVAALLSLWVIILAVINHGLIFHGRTGDGFSATTAIGVYLGGGFLTGALFGAFLPFIGSRVVAALLGMFACAPIAAGVLIGRLQYHGWSTVETGSLLTMVVVLGIPGGLMIRSFVIESESRNRHSKSDH